MNKVERAFICQREAQNWLILCQTEYFYVIEKFPYGFGIENANKTGYRVKDADICGARTAWVETFTIANSLRVAVNHYMGDKYREKTRNWLEGIEK